MACDYDLTGLARDAMCPECGAPIAETLNYLAASRRVDRGVILVLRLVIVGLAVWSAGLLVGVIYSILAAGRGRPLSLPLPVGLMVGAYLAAIVCYFLAFFVALSGRAGPVNARRARSPREAMCLGSAILLGLTILLLSLLKLAGNPLVTTSVAPLVREFWRLAFWAAPYALAAIFVDAARSHYFGPRTGLLRLCWRAVLCAMAPLALAAIIAAAILIIEQSYPMPHNRIPDRLPELVFVIWGCWQTTASVRIAQALHARARTERSAATL